ncbi:MAG: T9SS type A sorting domain-containing protein [Calditrichaeota bacterium]|nr:T9SS type A sorting domain-containing protein [Calditrichota bacterium]
MNFSKFNLVLLLSSFCLFLNFEYASAENAPDVSLVYYWRNLECYAAYVEGDTAYLGVSNSIKIVDFSDPRNPEELGETQLGSMSNINYIVKSQGYIYAGTGSYGIRVIDVSNPYEPQEVASVDIEKGYVYGMDIRGSYLYSADGKAGVHVIDISNPLYPNIVGWFDIGEYNSALNIVVRGNLGYLASSYGGLKIIDFSVPSKPVEISEVDKEYLSYDVSLSENYAYLVGGDAGLKIIDISNTENPKSVGILDIDDFLRWVTVDSPYAYIAGWYKGLLVADISDPLNIKILGYYDIDGRTRKPFVSGQYIFVPDRYGLYVFKKDTTSYQGLSQIAKDVLEVVQGYHSKSYVYNYNRYEKLSFTPGDPPGQNTGIDDFAELIKSAKYEVLFATMDYHKYDPARGDSPGDRLAKAIGVLYRKITFRPEDYPKGVTVRILVSNTPLNTNFGKEDQRDFVYEDLVRNGVSNMEFKAVGWKIEIGNYPSPPTHNHAKFLVLDGKTVLAGGYNMSYAHLEDEIDFGATVTGPAAHYALKAFDNLWFKAEMHDKTTKTRGHPPEVERIYSLPEKVNAFSLFRTSNRFNKESDKAVRAALEAAREKIDVLQVNFTLSGFTQLSSPLFWPDYMKGLKEAIETNDELGNTNFKVRLLIRGGMIFESDEKGIRAFQKWLNKEGYNDYVEIRRMLLPSHAKVVSIDDQFLIVGSQNWDFSAFGNSWVDGDLAEFNLGIDSRQACEDFLEYFDNYWEFHSGRYLVLEEDQNLKTAVESAGNGDVISLLGDEYRISEPITVNSGITIIGDDTKILSAASVSGVSGVKKPLLIINSKNVNISGLRFSNTSSPAIEINGSEAEPLSGIRLSNLVFDEINDGAIMISGNPGAYRIENCTFAGGEYAIRIDVDQVSDNPAKIRNNIFSGQKTTPIQIYSKDDGNVEYSYNLFDNCGAEGECVDNWYSGNLSSGSDVHDNLFDYDPSFVNPDSADYRLTEESPAIDAGSPDMVGERFFDGDGDGISRVDIGAFEYLPDTLFVAIDNDKQNHFPKSVWLSQNQPNPFNSVTDIRFGLSHDSEVRIDVFNILGQKVTTLVNAKMTAGYHRVKFNGNRFASGIYLYRIQAEDFVKVKKMILMK